MGYSDDELLTGRVPWKKRYDRPWKDVAQAASSMSISKRTWSKELRVTFSIRKLKQIFQSPTDLTLREGYQFLVLGHLVKMLQPVLDTEGCNVNLEADKVIIDWSTHAQTAPDRGAP
jgi:hypothetical protein